jgi:peptidyl-prolyl cis-trans isomerase SurA
MRTLFTLLTGLLICSSGSAATTSRPEISELDNIVAIVNTDVITGVELNKRIAQIKQQFQDKPASLPPDGVLRRQTLDRLVIETLQLQLAKLSGIRVDDEQLNLVITNIAKENHFTLEQFREVVAKDGIPFSEFREQIRNEMITTQLRRQRVDNNINITEQEVDNQIERQGNAQTENEFRVAHILIAVPEAASPEVVEAANKKAQEIFTRLRNGADFSQTAMSASAAPQALQGGDLGWLKQGQLPTVLADVVPTLKVGDISAPLRSASGFHLAKLVDKRTNQIKHVIEQTLARHILVKTDQVTTDAVARERLERIRQRILAGDDFSQLARASSADLGSGSDGGNLGWVSPGMMVPEFEEAMNKLKPSDISTPFQTRYGWHIVQVMSRRTHDDSKEHLRQQARQLIIQRKTAEETENWLRRLRAEAFVELRLSE